MIRPTSRAIPPRMWCVLVVGFLVMTLAASADPARATVPVRVAPGTAAQRTMLGSGIGPERSFRLPTTATSADPYRYHLLVLLVEFRDVRQSSGDDRLTPAVVYDRIFGDHPGTLASYWKEASHGRFVLEGTVSNWVRVDSTYAYYASEGAGNTGMGVDPFAYPHNVPRLVEEAVTRLGTGAPWPEYDVNADGLVDGLLVIHAGPGIEETGDAPADPRTVFLAHQFHTKTEIDVPGARVFDYAFVSADAGIGVAAHEFGHLLGLADLYDTGVFAGPAGPFGAGDWSLMATGALVNEATTPTGLDAFSRVQLHFSVPETIAIGLPPVERSFPAGDDHVVYLAAGSGTGKEYFLAEARTRNGIDAALPGEGLLIWHIDENQPANLGPNPYRVALEQADGRNDLGRPSGNRGDAGDAWPPPARFAQETNPSSVNHRNLPSWVEIVGITRVGDTVNASFEIAQPISWRLASYTFAERDGDGDGRLEAGEAGSFTFVACNDGVADAPATTFRLRIQWRFGSSEGQYSFPATPAGACVSDVEELTFTVPESSAGMLVADAFLSIGSTAGFSIPFLLLPPGDQILRADPGEPSWQEMNPSGGTLKWEIETTRFRSAPASWRLNPRGSHYETNLNTSYISPLLGVPTSNPRLELWSAIDAETLSTGRAFDGGIVEVLSPAASWQILVPAGGWSHELEEGSGNALAGTEATSGHDAAFHRLVFDMSPYAGEPIRIRYRFGSDPITVTDQSQTGWSLDDLRLSAGDPPPDIIAMTSGDSVAVDWTTTIGNGWRVYRRPDIYRGAHDPIADVPSANGTGPFTHRVVDHPPAGRWIYSVRPLDDDGPLLEYDAEPVTIDVARGTPAFSVGPNPWRLDAAPLTVEYVIGDGAAGPVDVRVRMFDVSGRLVATLVEAGSTAGHHEFRWPEDNGGPVPGVYFVRLDAAGMTPMTTRLVIIR